MKDIILVFIFGLFAVGIDISIAKRLTPLKIAVIGAGASGLASAKNALDKKYNVDIFEKSEALGGIWYYTDNIGKDKFGVDIHTPMYKLLRTNTPYQTMEFPGLSFPNGTQSYPTHNAVWRYLDHYATKYKIKKRIKYHHLVEHVSLFENDKWKIIVRDVSKNKTDVSIYDAVFVCTNIFSSPRVPKFEGVEGFKGKIMHSRDYRKPETFRRKDVLIIGSGPSGSDIALQIEDYASRLTISRHIYRSNQSANKDKAGGSVENDDAFKGDVKRFIGTNQVEFEDGTCLNFTDVIYATGYKYSYPFLDENVGIHVEDNYVKPLYKQILNIEYPTMAFIGIPYSGAHNKMCDLQARFALTFISRAKQVPSHTEMLIDMESQPKNEPHFLGVRQINYYKQLADTAGIENIPEVYANIIADSQGNSTSSSDFRNNVYIISANMKTFRKVEM
ncbi:dimethylaniline monooxygenase [N-oxide-forming] 3-like [Contarinia nasturtii]|uniref:dimethylaniline monooxygenase [N-oxide-forming] 3-like n=1 Tax=Contarinia nasturtii TaxID=265458 RepID=UPI0012D4AAC1|nr:dimethylaniline monooxygenase [N-oxide-forming] 3-like [Contarinia nasturtii]XP_031617081.1 dimethylaniline monooxygenase [N-oxide-forming] 3-like [Contarinia nasturtii]